MDTTICCCTGCFTSNTERQLLLRKEDHIEIWKVEEASKEPALVRKERVQGDVAALLPFKVSGWLPDEGDGVVVISEGTDLQLLCWDDQKQGLRELCHIPNALPSRTRQRHRRNPTSQAITLGSSLCCVIGGNGGQLTVAVVRKNEKGPIRFSGTFYEIHSSIDDHTSGRPLGCLEEVLSLAFLTDREGRPEVDLHGRPLLAQLYKETVLGASSVTLVLSALDCKTGELSRCWHLRGLDPSTRVMVASPGVDASSIKQGAAIVLLSGYGAIVYNRSGVLCARVNLRTEGAPTAAVQIREGLLVVGDTVGGLYAVDLSRPESAARLLGFGPEPESYLSSRVQSLYPLVSDAGHSVFVCQTDDGEAYVIHVPEDVTSCSVRRVASTELPELAPVHDFTVVHVSPQESELVLAHGVGRHGCLTRVQEAAELTVGDGLDLKIEGVGFPTLLPFSLADRPAVVLSYDTSSRLLHQCGDATWRPIAAPGFNEPLRTLAVGSVENGRFFVQVTSASVRLIDSLHPYGLRQERTDLAPANNKATRGGGSVHLADVRGSGVVVAGKDWLRTFWFDTDTGELEGISCRKCESQISAVGLSIRSEECSERRATNGQASTSGGSACGSDNRNVRSSTERNGMNGKNGTSRVTGMNGTNGTNGMTGTRSTQRNGVRQTGPNGAEEQTDCKYVVVGYWTTHVVEVLRWSGLEMVTRVQLGGSDLPRSVKLVEVGCVGKLLVGTAEGSVLCYGGESGRVEDIHIGPAWRVKVGSAPVSLSVLVSERAPGEVAEAFGDLHSARRKGKGPQVAGIGAEGRSGNRMEGTRPEGNANSEGDGHGVRVYLHSERAVLLDLTGPLGNGNGLTAERVVGGDGLLNVAFCADDTWLVVGDDGKIRTAFLDTRVRTRRRSVCLGVTPQMVAFHVSSNCLVAACASEQGAHSLRVFHARTFQQLAEVSFEKGHVPTCLLSATLPNRSIGDHHFEPYAERPDVAKETGEFLVVASTITTKKNAVSVLSVFGVEERPVKDDRVEFRLFLLGSYVAGSVICSVTPVSVPPAEDGCTPEESSGALPAESGRKPLRSAGPTTMLAIGTHEGLQVLSVAVDRTGAAAVAALEAQALLAALANGESVNSPRADGEADVLNTTLDQDPVAIASQEVEELGSPSNGDEVGLLVVKVDAEAKLSAAVTHVSASGNALFACTADGALSVLDIARTSAGVQLLPRARCSRPRFAFVFPLSASRALVCVRSWRQTILVERDSAAEEEHQEKRKRAAVRIGEARGLDLLETAGGTEDHLRTDLLKDLPGLKARIVGSRKEQDLVGFCPIFRGLRVTCDGKRHPGLLELEPDLVGVFANGSRVALPDL